MVGVFFFNYGLSSFWLWIKREVKAMVVMIVVHMLTYEQQSREAELREGGSKREDAGVQEASGQRESMALWRWQWRRAFKPSAEAPIKRLKHHLLPRARLLTFIILSLYCKPLCAFIILSFHCKHSICWLLFLVCLDLWKKHTIHVALLKSDV